MTGNKTGKKVELQTGEEALDVHNQEFVSEK